MGRTSQRVVMLCGWRVCKTVLPYLSALENALVIWYLKALYKCPGLLYFLGRIVVLRTQMQPIVTDRVA